MAAMRSSLYEKENKMKSMRIFLVMVLAIALLGASTCAKNNDSDGGDDADLPNFIQESCPGCPQETVKSNGFRFISHVKNIGGSGKIGMTISSSKGSATKEFTVTANTSYDFSADVPAQAKSSASFTYMAKFPGKAGYTDARTKNGFDCTGAPSNMELNKR
jgi:hypothetical protein